MAQKKERFYHYSAGDVTIDYNIAQIQSALLGWEFVELGDTPTVIHLRVDMDKAIAKLSLEDRQAVATIKRYGKDAFNLERGAVSFPHWSTIVRRIFQILNVLGTG
jgi:hypothetical protein